MVFWFHYNRPKTIKSDNIKISLHFQKKCHIVDGIDCAVATWSHARKEQPRFVMKGKCHSIKIESNIAYIT